MRKKPRVIKDLMNSMERSSLRSSLFWWMVEHCDDMVQATNGHRIRWADFCRDAKRLGLADTKGHPPSEGNARTTWKRARKAVAAERAKAAARPPQRPGSVYPSRIPKTWRPIEVPKPDVSALFPEQGKAVTPTEQGAREPYSPAKGLAAIERQLAERSGR